ncbi:hypothetical protein RhiXN_08364 [Rhizoctonia solani]|uniref:Uncharacterized protein n=1 Tax=Rhizoctonia solani TaxID=456999 RepID=A0A8H8P2C3_9AGAM|nr:uncharacterized protein RhiXN_08364 [Rhizoctonia solani]QRW23328.1 hypothetical protein RhiXN_08364 [Rhizoctonia solani]
MFTELFVHLLAGSGLVSSSAVSGTPAQKPLRLSQGTISQPGWDSSPSEDSYDNHIFFRLATLLRHWPNTRYPSGSSIIPGSIPVGTTLYYGRGDAAIPSEPDWLAFDPEHATIFTGGSNGRLFTFVTTRSLRVVYFDGAGGAKLLSGALDTQNLLAWGRIRNQTIFEEQALINDLCQWGKAFSIDGYVRMEMDFEIMYCDFHQGIEVVSSLHILPTEGGHVPGEPRDETNLFNRSLTSPSTRFRLRSLEESRPPHWRGALSSLTERVSEIFQAAAWHGRAPGEVRVRLDVARLVTLYDPALRTGTQLRRGLEKWCRLASFDDRDYGSVWLSARISPAAPQPDSISPNATAIVEGARAQLMIMLMPDLTPDTIPNDTALADSGAEARYSQTSMDKSRTHEWVKPILEHCSSYLVSHLPHKTFTREERTLYAGVQGTLYEICRVLSLLWSEAYDPLPDTKPTDLVDRWRTQVDKLMQWLDWPMWNKCTPECDLDVINMFYSDLANWGGKYPGQKGEEDLTKIDWTPKCVRKSDW